VNNIMTDSAATDKEPKTPAPHCPAWCTNTTKQHERDAAEGYSTIHEGKAARGRHWDVRLSHYESWETDGQTDDWSVAIEHGSVDLTPRQARAYAQALIKAAEMLEAARPARPTRQRLEQDAG
jgi:hypothetical protein